MCEKNNKQQPFIASATERTQLYYYLPFYHTKKTQNLVQKKMSFKPKGIQTPKPSNQPTIN